MSWQKNLGDQIRKARVAKGLSQEALATKTSITRAQISHIENGKSAPAVNIVTEIAAALDTDFFVDGYRIANVSASSALIAMPKQLAFNFDTEYSFQASIVEITSAGDQAITLSVRLRREIA
jgi:transcriptional regulator with XRE-family HTH domain